MTHITITDNADGGVTVIVAGRSGHQVRTVLQPGEAVEVLGNQFGLLLLAGGDKPEEEEVGYIDPAIDEQLRKMGSL